MRGRGILTSTHLIDAAVLAAVRGGGGANHVLYGLRHGLIRLLSQHSSGRVGRTAYVSQTLVIKTLTEAGGKRVRERKPSLITGLQN